jgi:hypothetical protein
MRRYEIKNAEGTLEERYNHTIEVVSRALNRHEEKLKGLGLIACLTGASIIITVLSQNYIDARITRLTKRIAELEQKGE